MQTPAASAAEQLLKQFLRVAQELTDSASPQDNFSATLSADVRFQRILKSIEVVAKHHIGYVVQALTSWRKTTQDAIKERFSNNGVVNMTGVCKRAAMEIMFLEASLQVMDNYQQRFFENRDFVTFYENIQNVVLRWVMNAEEYVPHPDLGSLRLHVVVVSSKIIGAMSKLRLNDLTAMFLVLLEERMNPKKETGLKPDNSSLRAQLLKLCNAMKRVTFQFGDDAQLRTSLAVLQRLHPLKHTAPVKKSQVHDALSDMLCRILTPLIYSGGPAGVAAALPDAASSPAGGGEDRLGGDRPGRLNPDLVAAWYRTMQQLKTDIWQWMLMQNKHLPDRFAPPVGSTCTWHIARTLTFASTLAS